MPKLVGAMKVKDEEIFIEKIIGQFIKYINALVVVDDWSTDKTIQIVQDICSSVNIPLKVEKSPYKTYHEFSDGNLELKLVHDFGAEWCIQLDADDVYEQNFVRSLPKYMALRTADVYYVGATHMWSIDDNINWWDVDTFRYDSGWVNYWTLDRLVGFQHRRPAFFKVYQGQTTCGYGRDHGYLCPRELVKNYKRCLDTDLIFAHFGYSTPQMVEKKCIRHGNIPPLTDEERTKEIIYPPDYKPEGFTPHINVNTFKQAWMNKENVQLKKMTRQIWG